MYRSRISPPICDEQTLRPGIASNGSARFGMGVGAGDEVGMSAWWVSIMKRPVGSPWVRTLVSGGAFGARVAAVPALGPDHDVQAVGRGEP